jgi:DNA-binding XRE family transcriptional regulator
MGNDDIATIIRDRNGRPQNAVIGWDDYLALLSAVGGEPPAGNDDLRTERQRVVRAAKAQMKAMRAAPVAENVPVDEDADDIALAERGEEASRREAAFIAHAADRLGIEIDIGVPHEVVKRELAGAHPVRAWREARGLNQAQLAACAGISRVYLTQIETGERTGTLDVIVKLARNLRCMVEDLIPDVAAT